MGLSSLPAPSEGILCVLIVNTALSLSIFKGLVRTILHIVGIQISSTSAPPPQPPPPPSPLPPPSSSSSSQQSQPSDHEPSCIEEFRSRVPTVRFGDAIAISTAEDEHECSVCLSQFEAESEINHLGCGHVFHKACLEKWFDYNYWNITCPLCRTPLIPEEDISCFW